jgi:riboflavin biosynthesis pyrimidine reductase
MDARVSRLHPGAGPALPLHGLYMAHKLRERGSAQHPFIYSNFIASLDGRIATLSPETQRPRPPPAITNPHDWRLYLELAAQADAVITSGRRLRELAENGSDELHCVHETAEGDLGAWRREHQLAPHPTCIVLTDSLELPLAALRQRMHGDIVILSSARAAADDAEALKKANVQLIAATAERVSGNDIRRLAQERGFATVYAIGGPEVLYTLVEAHMLNRLYLTIALKLLGGEDFYSLLRGPALRPPLAFDLHELYFDAPSADNPPLLFASFDRRSHGGSND